MYGFVLISRELMVFYTNKKGFSSVIPIDVLKTYCNGGNFKTIAPHRKLS